MQTESQYQVACFGEALWDILPSGALPGGAIMNVAYHLKKMGASPALITKIGYDDHGKKLVNYLTENGLGVEYFDIDYEHPTGVVYARMNDPREVTYDIVYPSAWDFINLGSDSVELVKKADFFVYGSLTSRSKTSCDTLYQLLDAANTKALDINLRPPYFNRNAIRDLLQKADILKMNISELELVTGWFSDFKNPEDRMKLLQERFNIQTIIVTFGEDGALVRNKENIYRHKGFKVDVVDTIGSGDSFLAGFIYQQLIGATIERSLEFASCMGAFTATRSSACPNYTMDEVFKIIEIAPFSMTANQ